MPGDPSGVGLEAVALLRSRLRGGRTAWTHLASAARSNGIGRPRVTEVLRLTGLDAVANRRVKGFWPARAAPSWSPAT